MAKGEKAVHTVYEEEKTIIVLRAKYGESSARNTKQ